MGPLPPPTKEKRRLWRFSLGDNPKEIALETSEHMPEILSSLLNTEILEAVSMVELIAALYS